MRKSIYVVLMCTGLATACHRSPAEKYGTCAPIARASSAQVTGLGATEYVINDPEQIRKLLAFANARSEVSQPTLSTMPAHNVSVTFFVANGFASSIGAGSNFFFVSCTNWKGTRAATPEELTGFHELLTERLRH
jgi:hypothetical protein